MKKQYFVRGSRSRIIGLAAAAVFVLNGAAAASIIPISSNDPHSQHGLGSYVGSIEYSSVPFATAGTLIISLTNTSDLGNGGFITGFLFNFDSADSNASASLDSATHPLLEVSNEFAGGPFGSLDAGAALGGNFLGNGNPSVGIGVGQTGMFEFIVAASDAGALSASSFISGENQHNFVVRFRGFGDDGSDTVPGMIVPGPGAISLLVLAGLVGVRRRRA